MIRRTSLLPAAILLGAMVGGATLTFRQRAIATLRAEHRQSVTQSHELNREKEALTRQSLESESTAASHDPIRRVVLAAVEIIKHQPPPASQPAELPSPSGPRGNRIFAELLEDPDYLRLCLTVFTQTVEENYGAVLASLQTEPQKAATLKRLLIERQFVDLEAEQIAVQKGLSSIAQPQVRYRARDQLEDEIRELIGPELHTKLNSLH